MSGTISNPLSAPTATKVALLALLLCLFSIQAGAQGSGRTTEVSVRGTPGAIAPAKTVAVLPAGTPAASAKKAASTGRVVGTIKDAVTGEPLVGGQVGVRGLPLGNVSDDSGAYFVNNVPVGKQMFFVDYLGYESQSKEHEVQGGVSTTLDFAMNPTPIEIDEVVVEEEIVRDLSEYVDKTSAPTFKPASVKEVAVAKSDTTLMEEWHRSMRATSTVHAIEYPLSGTKVYFRMPASKTSSSTSNPSPGPASGASQSKASESAAPNSNRPHPPSTS
jgi:hypothetical protein